MVIYTYGHEYPVLSVQQMNDDYNVYICNDTENGGFCRILCIKNKTLFPEIAGWLAETADPRVFTDYLEYFLFEENLCIVMKYTDGTTLAEKLSMDSMPLAERLELCRRILERAVLLEIPDYFLEKCFDKNNIIVSDDLSVSFNYPIEDIAEPKEYHPVKKAEELFKTVFAQELERKVPDELIGFMEKMPELYGSDMITLYDRYYSMLSEVDIKDSEAEEPKSIWFKVWEQIKKFWSKLKIVLMFLLLAAAVGYLVYTIVTSGSSKTASPNFDSIGTVTIDKNR